MVKPVDCLAVKVILLGIVNDTPELPQLNIPRQQHAPSCERTLSFKHERSIAEQLAFICAYSDDPLHVLAVCIEEADSRNGMTILLAANTGKHESLIAGLERIAHILQNEAIGGVCPYLYDVDVCH